MKIQTTRARLLASSMICGLTLLGGQAMAQASNDASTPTGQAKVAQSTSPNANSASGATTVGELVVTGSRIPTTNATAASPISVTSAADIAKTSAFGVGEALLRMTGPDSSNGGITNASNNGGVGISSLGLRNLGPQRTLVLVDGQRLVPIFVSSASFPDLNAIPVAMVDRIEVLRDGASSIYGADAIGGVVNIITKKNFEGLELDANGGFSQHGGGNVYGVNGTLGINSDKGNLTINLLHEKQMPVNQTARDWAQDPHIGDPNFEGGSIYRTQLNILQDTNSHTVWNNGIETTYNDPTLDGLPCLKYLPGLGRVKLNAGCPDVHPPQTLTSGLERTQISFNGHYDLTDDIRIVANGFYTRRNSEQRIRPEPLLGATIASTNPSTGATVFNGFEVPVSWPGYTDPNGTASPQACADPMGCIVANYTPNEFGPRDYKQQSSTYRIMAAVQGKFMGDYNWELGFVNQRNDTTQRTFNSGNWLHLAEATGQLPCVDVPGGCTFSPAFGYTIPTTPFNFFRGVNTLTPEQVAYLTTTLIDTNNSYENYVYATFNGRLFDLPGGPVKFAVGAERRWEHLTDNPDALVQLGYAANPSAATSGGYNVSSVYAELRVPIFSNSQVGDFTVTPSGRYDHYNNFGTAWTWKVGAEWKIIEDLRLRGTYATGFRAPSVAELYGGNGISYIPVSGDPCDSRGAAAGANGVNGNSNANGTASLASGSACYAALSAIGLNAAQIAAYQSPENSLANDQRGLVIGGNPTLQPEKSKSWNVGAILTPRFARGLSVVADYYQIKITNSILTGGIAQNAGPDIVVNGCYVDQNPDYCKLITRNGGGIFQINSQNTNFGVNEGHGLDMEVSFDTRAAGLMLPFPGSLVVNVQALRLFKSTTQNPDFSTNEFEGTFLYSNAQVQPKWKGTFNLDYRLNQWTFHWDTSYIGPVVNFEDPTTHVYGNYIPSYFYHNLSVGLDLPSVGPMTSGHLILGINNLFDKDPPFLGADGNCKCNSLAGPYDFVGRFFYSRISMRY